MLLPDQRTLFTVGWYPHFLNINFAWTLWVCNVRALLCLAHYWMFAGGDSKRCGADPCEPGWRGATCRHQHPQPPLTRLLNPAKWVYSSGLVAREMSATDATCHSPIAPAPMVPKLFQGTDAIWRHSQSQYVLFKASFPQPNNAYLILNAFVSAAFTEHGCYWATMSETRI